METDLMETDLMETIDLHVAKLETQLLQWDARLDELASKADVVAAEAKLDFRKRIEELKATHRQAQRKLDELKTAQSSEEWEIIQAGVESTWNELELALEKLTG